MIVSLQYLTVSWIKISEKSLILVYQLSRNSWFWYPMMDSSSGFNYLGINSAWIHCNRNYFCDSYLADVCLSDGLVSAPLVLFFFLQKLVRWESFELKILVDKDYWVFAFVPLTFWKRLTPLFAAFSVFSESIEKRYLKVIISFRFHWTSAS